MSASAAMTKTISGSMPRQSGGSVVSERITDNESNFESASYYLGRNLASQDRADIEDDDMAEEDYDVNEIPVWVHGEARWIGGVTEHTTAGDLVEALLLDDRSLFDSATGDNHPPPSAVLQQYVITERWRQMEQILESKTKVWKIWKAWGEAQCEVRLRLRRIDRTGAVTSAMEPQPTTNATAAVQTKKRSTCHMQEEEDAAAADDCEQVLYDSGRESPTAGSAIVRRRRHRASKSTAAWLTQAQTVHPKSTIEKLMSLILEQGETIQHQLSKLRDREIQISQLEEQKHKTREQEHGKNYLLETYLNGLHEAVDEEDEEKDQTTINSDSGVNTEDTHWPNEGASPTTTVLENEDSKKVIPSLSQHHPQKHTKKSHFEYSERENELLRDHQKLKSTPEAVYATVTKSQSRKHQERTLVDPVDGSERERQQMEEEIGMLEKIYAINKHLQKEEELLVRLNAKIKRYESANPNLKEDEILDTLNRLNSEIEQRNREIEITNREIELSDELLNKKSAILHQLSADLDETFDNEAVLIAGTHDHSTMSAITEPQQLGGSGQLQTNCFDVNPENIYNISKILLKYSDDGGVSAPETDRDWHDDRVNLAACHRGTVNKTDTNKRIIIGGATETGPVTEAGTTRHTVTTRVQVHNQPGLGHNLHQMGAVDFIDYSSPPSGNHYLPSPYHSSVVDQSVPNNVTDFTPVDLIAATTEPVPAAMLTNHLHHQTTMAYLQSVAPVLPGISDKVGAINSAAKRNISATLMDNKKVSNKNFILTSKAYEGLPPVAGATTAVATATDMTQLGTLV